MTDHTKKILFIVIDQLRADCVSGALASHVDLPNLSALKADSVSFENHYTVTNPCGPARVSLLTGQYAMNHRAVRNGTPLANGTPNLATLARTAGLEPMLYGYTDTTVDPRTRHPNDPALKSYERVMEGFAEQVEMRFAESYPWRAYLKAKGYSIPPYSEFYIPVSPDAARGPRPDDPAFYSAEDSDTAYLTDRFLAEMAVRTDEPWFAHLTYIRPHPPLVAPEPYNKMYDPAKLPPPIKHGELDPFSQLAQQYQPIDRIVKGCAPLQDDDALLLRAIYLGLATEVDHHVGRIMDFLKSTDQYDDTLIVVTADHGEMLGDHGLWGKQHIFDTSYRVSLLIRDPEQPAQHGKVVTELTESIDVAPTILDWIGVDLPPSMNGAALRPFLSGVRPEKWRDFVHIELDFSDRMPAGMQKQANLAILQNKRFKLVHFNAPFDPILFDLEKDPDELNNVAKDPAYTAALLEMTQALLTFRMENMDRSLSELI